MMFMVGLVALTDESLDNTHLSDKVTLGINLITLIYTPTTLILSVTVRVLF